MKWSRDHGLTCELNENDNCQHHRYTEWEYMCFGFEKTSKVRRVQAIFSSGFDLCDLEKSVKTDKYNTCDVTSLDTHTRKFHNPSYHHLPQKWYFYIWLTPPGGKIWNQIGPKFGVDIVSTWIHHHIKLELSRSTKCATHRWNFELWPLWPWKVGQIKNPHDM